MNSSELSYSSLCWQSCQGVVTYALPVEVFATGIKNLDRKIVLDCSITLSWGSWSLDFTGVQRTKRSHASLVSEKMRRSVDISCSEFVLIPWLASKKNINRLIYIDGNDSKGSYLVIQAARDSGTVKSSYKTQLACSRLSGDENLCPELTSAIYCIVWTFFSLQQAKTCNPQKYRLTEWAVCMWVTSKLTYWYIHNVCSVASRVKGYQALPFLTFHRHHSGEEPGNETIDFLPDAKGLSMVDKCAILSEAAWLHTWLHVAV